MRERRLLLGALLLAATIPCDALGQTAKPNPFSEVANFARAVPLPPPRPPGFAVKESPSPSGQLPMQTTGQHHEHTVRDICIGC